MSELTRDQMIALNRRLQGSEPSPSASETAIERALSRLDEVQTFLREDKRFASADIIKNAVSVLAQHFCLSTRPTPPAEPSEEAKHHIERLRFWSMGDKTHRDQDLEAAAAFFAAVPSAPASGAEQMREPEGDREPCYYCGKPCDPFAGDPGLWPVLLCHRDGTGISRWHHHRCIIERLEPAALATEDRAPPSKREE